MSAEPPIEYCDLNRDQLHERLAKAEAVCVMFGWSGNRGESDRELATAELWHRWARAVPVGFTSVESHPDLVAGETELADARRVTRLSTLERISRG